MDKHRDTVPFACGLLPLFERGMEPTESTALNEYCCGHMWSQPQPLTTPLPSSALPLSVVPPVSSSAGRLCIQVPPWACPGLTVSFFSNSSTLPSCSALAPDSYHQPPPPKAPPKARGGNRENPRDNQQCVIAKVILSSASVTHA